MKCIDLSLSGKGNFQAKRGILTVSLWFVIETLMIKNRLMPVSRIRVALLRLFGAKIGGNCRCPHSIRVKYPWNLTIGDNVWLGEDVWIYNQAQITIGSNVCISQGVFLTAGSHDVSGNMDLRVAPIVVEDGTWISTRTIVQMGVTIGRSAVVTPNSVVHRSLAGGFIHGGNPCRVIKPRFPSARDTQSFHTETDRNPSMRNLFEPREAFSVESSNQGKVHSDNKL
ncbi:putative colanic acid biosynthesis acetyltransferase [Trinickia dinghuensis]|uniref:Putative colanic acid biosynthesis acetyltransferase n=1 Tax=Trinickia dinghuensis TaxID=2291023 RepID=A0A3D8K2L4_9BURK|nr:putative colanic acid biosynthesis acetyltransferase [Trinickia dinghuensis]RDU99105.1 putative colanic acid biosynthesis acetyltransferase [Trinickia dinghuensis]